MSEDFAILKGKLIQYNGRGYSANIPDGVKVIGERAFYRSDVSVVNIPKSIIEIQDGHSVSHNDYTEYIGAFADSFIHEVNMENGTRVIGEYAFSKCRYLQKIFLPDTVERIGGSAFSMSGIEYIRLSNNLKSIGAFAFGLSMIEEIVIPEGVTDIPRMAFSQCRELKKVVLPSTLTSIGEQAFYCCSKLTKVVMPRSIKSIGKSAFSGCRSLVDINMEMVDLFLNADVGLNAFADVPLYADYYKISIEKRVCPNCNTKLSRFGKCKKCKIKFIGKN